MVRQLEAQEEKYLGAFRAFNQAEQNLYDAIEAGSGEKEAYKALDGARQDWLKAQSDNAHERYEARKSDRYELSL